MNDFGVNIQFSSDSVLNCPSVLFTAARNHVNRMCLAADVPLIESGTAGYLGQVTVIKKVSNLAASFACLIFLEESGIVQCLMFNH